MRSSLVYAAGTCIHQPDRNPTGESFRNPHLGGLKLYRSLPSCRPPDTRTLAPGDAIQPRVSPKTHVGSSEMTEISGNGKHLMSRNELRGMGAITVPMRRWAVITEDDLDKGFRGRCGGINFTQSFSTFPPFSHPASPCFLQTSPSDHDIRVCTASLCHPQPTSSAGGLCHVAAPFESSTGGPSIGSDAGNVCPICSSFVTCLGRGGRSLP